MKLGIKTIISKLSLQTLYACHLLSPYIKMFMENWGKGTITHCLLEVCTICLPKFLVVGDAIFCSPELATLKILD